MLYTHTLRGLIEIAIIELSFTRRLYMATEKASKRIPLTPTGQKRIHDFKNGFGDRYTEALLALLDQYKQAGESDFEAGRRLRQKR